MAGYVIEVPEDAGPEIVVTFPGQKRVLLTVTDGRVTVHDEDIARAVLASVPGAVALEEQATDYDPDAETVDEVNAHLDKHPEEAAAVLAREADGRNRKGIVEGPHAVAAAEQPAEEDLTPADDDEETAQ